MRGFLRDPLLTIANSVPLLTLAFALVFFGGSGLFAVVEHHTFTESMYWCITTMSTTGYGDISPKTGAGEVLAGSVMALSVFFLGPLLVAQILGRLMKNRDAWTHEEQCEVLDNQRALMKHFNVEKEVN
jgi:voltage-gated potassium channel